MAKWLRAGRHIVISNLLNHLRTQNPLAVNTGCALHSPEYRFLDFCRIRGASVTLLTLLLTVRDMKITSLSNVHSRKLSGTRCG